MDLRDAAANMPAVRKTDGHVDKYTAEAMLGRAWLFYTGMYGNGDDLAALTSTTYNPLTEVALPDGTTLTKQEVISYIDDCVNNSGYSLVPDFRNLWAYTNRCTVEDYDYTKGQGLKWVEDDAAVNPESMFAIKFNKLASWQTTIGYANGYALHFGVRGGQDYAKTFPFGQGWGAGPVAPNLMNDWNAAESGDNGWQNDNLMQTGNIHDLVLIRFADVLLMQSELKEDVSGINRVRARAGLAPIGAYSLTALQNERRWELAFEGVRWNDIRRWHIAAAALEKQTNQPVYYLGSSAKNTPHSGGYAARYNATAGFFKIPETEVSLSNGALVQNEGWTDASS